MNNYEVYKLVFPNNKIYIGMTKQGTEKRCQPYHYKRQPIVFERIYKHGWEHIKIIILNEGLSKKEAEEKEYEHIQKYESNNIEFGYNIANGGHDSKSFAKTTKEKIKHAHTGIKFSEERKLKISKALSGRKLSEEHKAKIILRHKGNKYRLGAVLSEESKKKISEAHKKIPKEKRGFYGKKHTNEAIEKISRARKGKSYGGISVNQYDKNLKFIRDYKSIKEASIVINTGRSNISKCCKGKAKTAGGFIWEYKDNNLRKLGLRE